jgi:hypothetical protein
MTALELLARAQIVRVLILTSVDGGPASEHDVRARIDQNVVLHAAIELAEPRGRCAWITGAAAARGRCVVLAPPEGAKVTWSKVEADRAAYDNVPGGEFRVAPIGWLESSWAEGTWSIAADVRPIARKGIAAGAGTMRYRVAIALADGRSISSPGLSSLAGGPGHAADLRKVSLRIDDSYLGVMTELSGLPYIFGSTELGREPHQAERAIGVDCADLMIYGLRLRGFDLEYRSSRTLGPISRAIAKSRAVREKQQYLDEAGKLIAVGPRGVKPGDWIIFAGHVGAFYADRGAPGVLDEEDLLLHIAWKELAIEPMIETGYGEQPFEVRRARVLSAE